MKDLSSQPGLLFDGLGGDVLGESGFFVDGLHECHETDRILIAKHCIDGAFDSVLTSDVWPSAADTRDEIISYIDQWPRTANQAELAFLMLRTRRSTAIWAQNMIPAGQVVVCPFMDLDHVRVSLQFDPAEKRRTFMQRECLRHFWPRYFAIPGSHNFPSDIPAGRADDHRKWWRACHNSRATDLTENDGWATLNSLVGGTTRNLLRL